MSFTDHYAKLQQADQLIRHKATGIPEEFARKLSVSERTLYHLLEEMKSLRFPIAYSKERCSYYYTEEGRMVDNIFVREDKGGNHKEMD